MFQILGGVTVVILSPKEHDWLTSPDPLSAALEQSNLTLFFLLNVQVNE